MRALIEKMEKLRRLQDMFEVNCFYDPCQKRYPRQKELEIIRSECDRTRLEINQIRLDTQK